MPVKTCLVHSVMPDDKRVCVSMFIDAADCWQVFELMPEWHARAIEAVSKDIPEPWLAEALDSLDKCRPPH